jgi:hypothetical protein
MLIKMLDDKVEQNVSLRKFKEKKDIQTLMVIEWRRHGGWLG